MNKIIFSCLGTGVKCEVAAREPRKGKFGHGPKCRGHLATWPDFGLRSPKVRAREGWGGRRDLNPQQPEPQSGALPLSYGHQPETKNDMIFGESSQVFTAHLFGPVVATWRRNSRDQSPAFPAETGNRDTQGHELTVGFFPLGVEMRLTRIRAWAGGSSARDTPVPLRSNRRCKHAGQPGRNPGSGVLL